MEIFHAICHAEILGDGVCELCDRLSCEWYDSGLCEWCDEEEEGMEDWVDAMWDDVVKAVENNR